MTKTPEEYFQDQDFQPEPETREENFTEAEKAFLEKYLGMEEPGILEKLGIDAPVETRGVPVPPVEPLPEAAALSETEPLPEPEEALEEALEELGEDVPPAAEPAQGAVEAETAELLPEPAAEEEIVAAAEEALEEAVGEDVLPEEDLSEELEAAESLAEEAQPQAPEELAAAPEEAAEDAASEATEVVAEAQAEAEEQPLEDWLREQEYLQLVSFYVGHQEFTLPIEAVQEVVRAVKPSKVPEAPDYMAGLVNLRGRVTPLVRLDTLLGVKRGAPDEEAAASGEDNEIISSEVADDGEDRFIIVCRKQGLQVGLLVREIATMYRTSQQNMEWNIESRLGGAVELVTALMRRQDDTLVGVLSMDRVVERILKR